MKPFARIKLSSAALRTGILVSSLALAVAAEWLIIKYRIPIMDFLFYDQHVSVVRTALRVVGGMVALSAIAFAVSRRISRCKCDMNIMSDFAALRGFAVAMLFVLVFRLTLMVVVFCDAMLFEIGAMSCFTLFGSVVAIRANRKRWIIVYLIIWMLAGTLAPAI